MAIVSGVLPRCGVVGQAFRRWCLLLRLMCSVMYLL
jgi:hypothetical protein